MKRIWPILFSFVLVASTAAPFAASPSPAAGETKGAARLVSPPKASAKKPVKKAVRTKPALKTRAQGKTPAKAKTPAKGKAPAKGKPSAKSPSASKAKPAKPTTKESK